MKRLAGTVLGAAAFAFATLAADAQEAPGVYFIGNGGDTDIRNKVYMDLLSTGLTVFDIDQNEVMIPGLGYDVLYVNHDEDDPSAALADYDVVVAHESSSSGEIGAYADKDIGYLVIEQAIAGGNNDKDGYIWFGDQNNVMWDIPGDFEIRITDNTHPITSLWDEGETIAVTQSFDAMLSGFTEGALSPGVTPLAEVVPFVDGSEVRTTLAVADAGADGLSGNPGASPPAGVNPAPARRAFLGFHERVNSFVGGTEDPLQISILPDGAILFQRVIQWLAGLPVTADGTEAGAQLPPDTAVAEWSIH